MRHDTSYAIYLLMLQKGYFKEIIDKCIIDCAAPKNVNELKKMFMNKFNTIEEFLASNESNNYAEYFKYILHHLYFTITNKFLEKYDNQQEEIKMQKRKEIN